MNEKQAEQPKPLDEKVFKPIARGFLESSGFSVLEIPREARKTPDFLVEKGGEKTLIELKLKGDDPTEIEEANRVLEAGEIWEQSKPTGPRDRLRNIISDGSKQCLKYDPAKSFFHVVWIHLWGRETALNEERLLASLYGTQKLISMQKKNVVTAYYFQYSAFVQHRENLDAVLISVGDALQFCINTRSTRIDAFRKSLFYAAYIAGLMDPDKEVGDPHTFFVPIDSDLKDSEKVLAILREKYGVKHLQPFDFTQYTAAKRVSEEPRAAP